MTEKSSKKGKLAIVPSVTFDKHMGQGLVLEQRDQDTLKLWEEGLRKLLRGKSRSVTWVSKAFAGNACSWAISTPTNKDRNISNIVSPGNAFFRLFLGTNVQIVKLRGKDRIQTFSSNARC